MKKKTGILTGAGGIIGQSIINNLILKDFNIVASDINVSALKEQYSDNESVIIQEGDISDINNQKNLVNTALSEFEKVDVLINNAGLEGTVEPIDELNIDSVRKLYEVNVFSIISLSGLIAKEMKKNKRGRIINMASGAGLAGTPYMTPYNSSKHAVVGVTKCLALELGSSGIQVNAVCPGCVESEMMKRIENEFARLEGQPVSWEDGVPLNRYAKPEEIADLVSYLAIDAPEYINGQALVIDGGMRA